MKKLILGFVAMGCIALGQAQEFELETFAVGINDPVDIQNAGDDRLFVVEQGGLIEVLDTDGEVFSTFLNITSLVSGGNEQGLLGLAFHPDYANNGYFYVNYTKTNGDTQISRFTVSDNPNVADPTSELPIISYDQPETNHNGGFLDFGADGLLYIATGDGGGGGDPDNNAQNKQLLLGKILRIDIDNPTGGNNFGIPPDNPYVGDASGRDEIWAIGLRNPWKYDFDPESNDLWIADVGQNSREEINRVDYTVPDLNYGWRCYEGTNTFNLSNCPPASDLIFPVFEYVNQSGGGCSITGGKVYRGNNYPNFEGYFFYADLCDNRIAAVTPDNTNVSFGNFAGNTWTTFGRDVNGELYVAGFSGTIFKIIDASVILANDVFTQNGFKVFPNPATNVLNLSSENDVIDTITIYDVKGSLVYVKSDLNTLDQQIDISELTQGLYITEITSQQGSRFSQKLVIN